MGVGAGLYIIHVRCRRKKSSLSLSHLLMSSCFTCTSVLK